MPFSPRSRARHRSLLAGLLLPLLSSPGLAAQGPPPTPGLRQSLSLVGRGVQIYTCQATPAGTPAWAITAPEADLIDEEGRVLGHHTAGPTWQLNDSSSIHGVVVSRQDSPEVQAIPWLVLRATDPQGRGALAPVVEIRREQTHGGIAPPLSTCTAGTLGTTQRVPYSAMYRFFTPITPPAARP